MCNLQTDRALENLVPLCNICAVVQYLCRCAIFVPLCSIRVLHLPLITNISSYANYHNKHTVSPIVTTNTNIILPISYPLCIQVNKTKLLTINSLQTDPNQLLTFQHSPKSATPNTRVMAGPQQWGCLNFFIKGIRNWKL